MLRDVCMCEGGAGEGQGGEVVYFLFAAAVFRVIFSI